MLRRVTVFAVLSLSAGALRKMDLEASEGETAGRHAFPGGDSEASCKACSAVMSHIERELAKPFQNEYMGPSRREAKKEKSAKAKALNTAAQLAAVINPASCNEAMKKYDLAYVNGENTFHYKESGGNFPVHMELNDWAKQELGAFCESFMEE